MVGNVKSEPTEDTIDRQTRERTPSNELHIYSVEELSAFRKRELIADAELLDGEC